jgi:phenylacetate-CoA ligase
MIPRGLLRGLVFPVVEGLTRTRFWSYYKESLRFDRWNEARRDTLRRERLARVWNAALSTTLHRQRLTAAGLSAECVRPHEVGLLLERLAPVTKTDFRRHFPDGVTTGCGSSDWRYQSTAGTTDRMTVIADFRKRDHNRSGELRALRLALGAEVSIDTVEIPANACNLVCGLADTAPASLFGYLWQALRGGTLFSRTALTELRGRFERQMVFRLHTLPPPESLPISQLAAVLDRYLERIALVRPAHLRAFPLYLLWLADRCTERGFAPSGLEVVSPYGGLASPAMTTRIARGLGCRFVQKYGTSELGVVAASCGRSPGAHVLEDLFDVAIVRRGRPVPPGEVGRLAITDLVNTAMPLLRYDVGDVGRLHTGPCPCGRLTARLEVLGRAQEVLDTPGGPLTASDVADTVFCDPAVANFRLEEVAPNCFEAALVGRDPGTGDTPDPEAWRERFAALHGKVRRLRARTVTVVSPEPSGKYRFVLPQPTGSDIL